MDLNKFVSLVGVLCRNASNLSQFFLEDSSGSILLDLSESVCDEVYVMNSLSPVVSLLKGWLWLWLVLSEEMYSMSRYEIEWDKNESISHPPAESRETSLRVLREVEYLGIAHDSEVRMMTWIDE